jgi:hypothetical protein
MDSRAYLFIFPINKAADIPDDFCVAAEGRRFERGIFLPQDDTNWFTRTPEYPARLLLMNGRSVFIVPHPTSGRRTTELNLDELVQVETGSSLLLGWIQFSTCLSTERLIYNTRASWALDNFMAALTRRWLGAPAVIEHAETKSFGSELDIKFDNLLADALDRDESVLSRWFSAPLEYHNKFFLFRKQKWRPGHLVALTSGSRLLWLKDEYRGHWERYAGITISAPISRFRCCTLETTPDRDNLVIDFMAGSSWRIAIFQPDSGCSGFSKTLNASFFGRTSSGSKILRKISRSLP